jgi:hypothetical protein
MSIQSFYHRPRPMKTQADKVVRGRSPVPFLTGMGLPHVPGASR